VSEDVEGFRDLAQELIRKFPEIPAMWQRDILLPPFSPNERVLYDRKSQT
jgi:hypothetical protein